MTAPAKRYSITFPHCGNEARIEIHKCDPCRIARKACKRGMSLPDAHTWLAAWHEAEAKKHREQARTLTEDTDKQ